MPEPPRRRRDLRCPYCGCAVQINQDERAPGYGDPECTGCAASWSKYDGAAEIVPEPARPPG